MSGQLLHVFLYGLLVGAIVAAPVGPIGAASLTQALAGRLRVTLAIVAGSVAGEAVNTAIAIFGSAAFSHWLSHLPTTFYIAAGFILIAGGLAYLSLNPHLKPRSHVAFLASFQVTVLSLYHIPNLIAVITALGLPGYFTGLLPGLVFLLAELVAVTLVWTALITTAWHFRHRLNQQNIMPWLHRGVGVLLMLLGLHIIVKTLAS